MRHGDGSCEDPEARRASGMAACVYRTASLMIAFALTPAAGPLVYGQEAAQLYEQTCALCHGSGGKGDGPNSRSLQPKPADLTAVVKGKSDAYLIKVVTEGGPAVGKSPLMPSYKGILDAKQIQGVVRYVRGLPAP